MPSTRRVTARRCLADVALGALGDQDITEIAGSAGVVDDDAIAKVVAQADGNALLAVEAARAIARGDTALAEGLRSDCAGPPVGICRHPRRGCAR